MISSFQNRAGRTVAHRDRFTQTQARHQSEIAMKVQYEIHRRCAISRIGTLTLRAPAVHYRDAAMAGPVTATPT
jgi:hypothetical protein